MTIMSSSAAGRYRSHSLVLSMYTENMFDEFEDELEEDNCGFCLTTDKEPLLRGDNGVQKMAIEIAVRGINRASVKRRSTIRNAIMDISLMIDAKDMHNSPIFMDHKDSLGRRNSVYSTKQGTNRVLKKAVKHVLTMKALYMHGFI